MYGFKIFAKIYFYFKTNHAKGKNIQLIFI